MRKIYSIVLMAAALLIGTNAWAETVATVTLQTATGEKVVPYESFDAALSAVRTASDRNALATEQGVTLTSNQVTIQLQQNATFSTNMWVQSGNGVAKKLTIDLNGKQLVMNEMLKMFVAYVEITGVGTIDAQDSGILPLQLNGYNVAGYGDITHLIIGKDVNVVTSNSYSVLIYPNSGHAAYGVILDVYGYLGGTITINGTVNIADPVNQPHINIHEGATVAANSECAAIYAAGYGVWNIEGTLTGGMGIYAKAGDITLDGATITATGDYAEPVAWGNGYYSTGDAIVYDSHVSYATGGMALTVKGETTVTSENGYAIHEVATSGEDKQPDLVITSGTFEGADDKGVIITTDAEKNKLQTEGTISGGTFVGDANITEYLGIIEGTVVAVTDEEGNTNYVVENINPAVKSTDLETATEDQKVILNSAAENTVTIDADKEVAYLALAGKDKVVVTNGATLKVGNVAIGEEGQIEVMAGSKLIVSGENGIVSNYASNLVLHTSETEQAIFLLNPAVASNKHPKATVEFITKSFMKEGVNVFQRFGIPTHTALESMECSDPSIRTRVWEYSAATDSWQEFGNLGSFDIHQLNVPFAGYNMISYRETPGLVYTMKGSLVGNDDASLDANMHWTTFANSFSADIDVAQFVASINGTVDPTVYMYKVTNALTQEYTWEPVNATILGDFHDESLSKIAPMRAFILNNKGTSAQLNAVNYASMVWAPATSVSNPAPRRAVASNNTAKLSVKIANEQGAWDKLYLLENDDFSAEYESGRDAEKYMNEDINVYAQAEEKQAILATNDLSDTYVGFSTVKGGKFTISFANVEGRELTLVDHETGARVAMVEGNTYEFTAAANSVNDYRFEIVSAAKLPTAIENAEAVKSAKGIYTITGQYVGEMSVWNSLPAGIYVVNGEKLVK